MKSSYNAKPGLDRNPNQKSEIWICAARVTGWVIWTLACFSTMAFAGNGAPITEEPPAISFAGLNNPLVQPALLIRPAVSPAPPALTDDCSGRTRNGVGLRPEWQKYCQYRDRSLPIIEFQEPRTMGEHRVFLPRWKSLTSVQQSILESYLRSGSESEASESWEKLSPAIAASFLSITHALSKFEMRMGENESVTALDLVRELKGVRKYNLSATLDDTLLDRWKKAGACYVIHKSKNRRDEGCLHMWNSTIPMGGAIHSGYETQWFTGVSKMPRIQWNYREKDSQAEIDLDYFPPLWKGFFPNPFHHTRWNSDNVLNYGAFVKKFGTARFNVTRENPTERAD